MPHWESHDRLSKQQGVSLIELLMVVVGSALIVAVAISLFSGVHTTSKSRSTVQQVLSIQSSIKSMYPDGDTQTLTNAGFAASGRAPKQWIDSSGVFRGPWGGSAAVVSASLAGFPNNGYRIQFPNVPSDNCVEIVRQLEPAFEIVQVGVTFSGRATLKHSYQTPPIELDLAALQAACTNPRQLIVLFGS